MRDERDISMHIEHGQRQPIIAATRKRTTGRLTENSHA